MSPVMGKLIFKIQILLFLFHSMEKRRENVPLWRVNHKEENSHKILEEKIHDQHPVSIKIVFFFFNAVRYHTPYHISSLYIGVEILTPFLI